jgi:sec-independent protein translocase protein TatA
MQQDALNSILAMFGMPGWAEIVIIGFVGLLFFGRRLPDVARSLGKSVVEFKKGVRDLKDDVDLSSTRDSNRESHLLESQRRSSLPSPPPVPNQTSNQTSAPEPREGNKAAIESRE